MYVLGKEKKDLSGKEMHEHKYCERGLVGWGRGLAQSVGRIWRRGWQNVWMNGQGLE